MKYSTPEETPCIHSAEELKVAIEFLEQVRAHLI